MKKSILSLALISCLSAAAHADSPAWNTLQLGFNVADVEGINGYEPYGFSLAGTALVSDDLFVGASFGRLSDDVLDVDLDYDTTSVGIGYRLSATENTDVFAAISYEHVELTGDDGFRSESFDESGYGITVGLRSMVTNALELRGAISYVDIDDADETTVSFGADYFITDRWSLGATYDIGDDVDVWGVNARYVF